MNYGNLLYRGCKFIALVTMNLCKVRKLRSLLELELYAGDAAPEQEDNKGPQGYLKVSCGPASHVACISSWSAVSFLFCWKYSMFLNETPFDSSLCALKKLCGWLHPPRDLILRTSHPLLPESSGPVTVTGGAENSYSREGTSASWIRDGSQQQCILSLSFWRTRRHCSLWTSWPVGLVGAGAGYHAVHVLPVTGADKPKNPIRKAAKPEIWPFTGV